jgi:hypothetical protein
MVGIHYEQIKQKQQEIEVRALAALIAHGNHYYKAQAQRKLFEIGMPEIAFDEGIESLEAFEKRTEK